MFTRTLLSLQVDGLVATAKRVRTHMLGREERYVFVQHLEPPSKPVQLPVETQGVVIRQMTKEDRTDTRVRWYEPVDVHRLALGVVATREGRIAGAQWFTDSVTPDQPWYQAVEPHLIPPARFDANTFAVPGDRSVAWALVKTATDALATAGVRSTVALVGTENKRSIFLLRLSGAKIVARMQVRHLFGHRTTSVELVAEDKDTATRTAANNRTGH